MSLGHVGAIFALEASRLARSNLEWHRLMEICGLTRTLVVDEDGCYCTTRPTSTMPKACAKSDHHPKVLLRAS